MKAGTIKVVRKIIIMTHITGIMKRLKIILMTCFRKMDFKRQNEISFHALF